MRRAVARAWYRLSWLGLSAAGVRVGGCVFGVYLRRLHAGESRRFASVERRREGSGVGHVIVHGAGVHAAVYWTREGA